MSDVLRLWNVVHRNFAQALTIVIEARDMTQAKQVAEAYCKKQEPPTRLISVTRFAIAGPEILEEKVDGAQG